MSRVTQPDLKQNYELQMGMKIILKSHRCFAICELLLMLRDFRILFQR